MAFCLPPDIQRHSTWYDQESRRSSQITKNATLTQRYGARARALELTLAHSPDSDDTFTFYGLVTKKVKTDRLAFTHVLEDIQSLNQKGLEGVYDITAISFSAYAFLAEQYILLPCGTSFGDRYGPMVVARSPLSVQALKGKRVAVLGAG